MICGKGHTPKIGYFAPGSAATLQDVTCDGLLGWVMHAAERLHFLGRIPMDEEGRRCPTGGQVAWQGLLEADLRLQSLGVPEVIPGLAHDERNAFKRGLEIIHQTDREALLGLRALISKANKCTNKAIQGEELDALANWVDRILDQTRGYTEAHTWTMGTSKAPPLPTHLEDGGGPQ